MKKLFIALVMSILVFTLAACTVGSGKGDLKQVYIIEYVSVPALDDACEGIIAGLKEKGFEDGKNIKITIMNPEAETAKLQQMVETAVQKADIIFCIATPVAIAAANEVEKQFSDVPVIFTAVTDPVDSHIIDNAERPGKNVSGTNDMNPVADQVALVKELNPDATKLGFIYTTGEPNSEKQLELARAACEPLGISVVAQSATNSTDVGQVLDSLIGAGIDALYIPTDNGIASQMGLVAQKCNAAKVVTICGESGQLKDGGIITFSINYLELGKMTGIMGANALNGANVAEMAVQGLTSFELVINKDSVVEFELPIPESLLNRAKDIK